MTFRNLRYIMKTRLFAHFLIWLLLVIGLVIAIGLNHWDAIVTLTFITASYPFMVILHEGYINDI